MNNENNDFEKDQEVTNTNDPNVEPVIQDLDSTGINPDWRPEEPEKLKASGKEILIGILGAVLGIGASAAMQTQLMNVFLRDPNLEGTIISPMFIMLTTAIFASIVFLIGTAIVRLVANAIKPIRKISFGKAIFYNGIAEFVVRILTVVLVLIIGMNIYDPQSVFTTVSTIVISIIGSVVVAALAQRDGVFTQKNMITFVAVFIVLQILLTFGSRLLGNSIV